MKRLTLCLLLLIIIYCEKYFELSYLPVDEHVTEEYSSSITTYHTINTHLFRINFHIFDVNFVEYNKNLLSTDDYTKNIMKLPGVQIEFNKSGEYLINFKVLSNKCFRAKLCRVLENHLIKVDINSTRMLSQEISTGTIVAIIFCVLVILIVLLTVLLLFNMKKIRKWWYGNKKDDSRAYFPNLEENPNNDVPYPLQDKTKSIELA
jgi:hypothetical protein